MKKGATVSHKKKGRYDQTSWHNTKQETNELRQLRAISCTAEIFKENQSSEVYAQCTYCSKRSRFATVFCKCGKKLGGLTAKQEKNDQVTVEEGCQIIQSLVQLRITKQVGRGQRHGTSGDQAYWAVMRDHVRRCTKKGVVDTITKQKTFSKDAMVVGKKTKCTRIKCSSTDIQKKNCRAGTLQ